MSCLITCISRTFIHTSCLAAKPGRVGYQERCCSGTAPCISHFSGGQIVHYSKVDFQVPPIAIYIVYILYYRITSCDQGPCKSESARFYVVYTSGHCCKDGDPQSGRALPAAPTIIPACTAVPSTRTAQVCPCATTGKACSPQSTRTATSG